MTLQELINNVAVIRNGVDTGRVAYYELDKLIARLEKRIDQNEPLNVPLSQSQVDEIVATYIPLYLNALTQVEAAGDLLGSDLLH